MISPALEFSMLRGDRRGRCSQPARCHRLRRRIWSAARRAGRLPGSCPRSRRSPLLATSCTSQPASRHAEIDRTLALRPGWRRTRSEIHNSRVTVRAPSRANTRRAATACSAATTPPSPPRAAPQPDPLRPDPGRRRVGADAAPYAVRAPGRAGLSHGPRILPAQPRGQRPLDRQHLRDATGVRRRAPTSCRRHARTPGAGRAPSRMATPTWSPYGVSQYLIDQLAPLESARSVELKVYRGGT